MEFSRLTNMQMMYLSNNSFSGAIHSVTLDSNYLLLTPGELLDLSSMNLLNTFYFGANAFTGVCWHELLANNRNERTRTTSDLAM